MGSPEPEGAFGRIRELLERQGAQCRIHEHQPTRTIEEARANLSFDVARIVKTIAFQVRDGRLALAALRGIRRVDYAALAGELGVSRRDLASLSPQQVLERLGVEPGSVSPLPVWPIGQGIVILLDEDVLAMEPTAYCGSGRPDRTLEMIPRELLRLSCGRTARFSRPAAPEVTGATPG